MEIFKKWLLSSYIGVAALFLSFILINFGRWMMSQPDCQVVVRMVSENVPNDRPKDFTTFLVT